MTRRISNKPPKGRSGGSGARRSAYHDRPTTSSWYDKATADLTIEQRERLNTAAQLMLRLLLDSNDVLDRQKAGLDESP